MTKIVLITTGAGTWTVPADWNNASNTIGCLGGGADGGLQIGGGGGAWAQASNVSLTPGAVLNVAIGARGSTGGDTWIRTDGGSGAPVNTSQGTLAKGASGQTGGVAASCVGTTTFSGGGGGNYDSTNASAGSGGGAAGPNGAGGNSASSASGFHGVVASGAGDNGFGGASQTSFAAGNPGTELDATHGCGSGGVGGINVANANANGFNGGNYGAGGGGEGQSGWAIGQGTSGLIYIVYNPAGSHPGSFFLVF